MKLTNKILSSRSLHSIFSTHRHITCSQTEMRIMNVTESSCHTPNEITLGVPYAGYKSAS